MHTHLWWAGFVIRSGKWTNKILDIQRWGSDHKPMLSMPMAETLGGSCQAISLPPLEPDFLCCFCPFPYCLVITASWKRAAIDQNWVRCWWRGFLTSSCHIPGGPASNSQFSSLACGLCRLKDWWIHWAAGSSTELWPLGGPQFDSPFPFSVIECQKNRWRVGRMKSRLNFSKWG